MDCQHTRFSLSYLMHRIENGLVLRPDFYAQGVALFPQDSLKASKSTVDCSMSTIIAILKIPSKMTDLSS